MREAALKYIAAVAAFFVLVLVVALLAGCQSPTSTRETVKETVTVQVPPDVPTATSPTGQKIYVVNSLWKTVKSDTLSKSLVHSLARDITSTDLLQQEIDAYNAANTDDLLRLYYGEVPPVSEAPTVDVFVVNPVTHEINSQALGIERQALIDDHDAWVIEAQAQELYIDHVPPAPPNPADVTPYAYYAIYVVNADGSIEYEDHCGYLPDNTFDGAWILDQNQGGWHTLESYFYQTQSTWDGYVAGHAGSYKVLRSIYTPPVTP